MLYSIQKKKNKSRIQRKRKIRSKISGTADLPRVSIFKSNKYLSAQAIDDVAGNTLASISGKTLGLKVNKKDAKIISEKFAEVLKSKNIKSVLYDRNGYLYHGVIAEFANSLRESGIKV